MIFIAEIGMNHNGNMGLIFELVKQAAYANADYAKFQLGWRNNVGDINNIQGEEIELIFNCCQYFNIKPLFSIINPEAYQLLDNKNIEAFKVASRTVNEYPELVNKIISTGKKTFISLGMTDKSSPFGTAKNIDYLWCKSEYPAYPWNLTGLPKTFVGSGFQGYSDHSVGIDVAILAIARGATVIEKHFTLDKSDTTIRDHALSATPDEFGHLVKIGRLIYKNLQTGV